jgi:hypothetical protein
VAGQIDMTFINTATTLPFVRAGSVKALGLTSLKRIAAAPEIPTMDEAGLRGLSFSLWAALFAPHDTPRDIIDKLNTAAVNTLRDPNVRQKLEVQGFEIPRANSRRRRRLAFTRGRKSRSGGRSFKRPASRRNSGQPITNVRFVPIADICTAATTAVIQLPRQRVQAVRVEGLIRSLWLS